jgi:magnesium transporter
MIRSFYIKDNEFHWEKSLKPLSEDGQASKMVWIDLQSPSPEELSQVERQFNLEFFTPQEAAEIESSSRYYEDEGGFEANTAFVVFQDPYYNTRQVSFILKDNILFTLRHTDLKSFAETVRKIKTFKKGTASNPIQICLLLLETQTDLDADFIEYLTRTTNKVSKKLLKERSVEEEILLRITGLQENTILIRGSIMDKQRFVSALLRSHLIEEPEKERLRIIIKDINSLLQHTEFSFERLEYLQNTFLGLVNIQQNQVIKIFTVVTVVFLPPTLIASIYGMNFDLMPELHWRWGYWFAIGLMVFSSLAFLWYFRLRKWL